jgi:hypothetical protein
MTPLSLVSILPSINQIEKSKKNQKKKKLPHPDDGEKEMIAN